MSYTPLTLLDIKKGVAAQLGKTDFSTPNTVRDIKINDARREVYSITRWKFRRKTAQLSFTTSVATDLTTGYGLCPFPTDFSPGDDPYTIRHYPSVGQLPVVWLQVNLEDIQTYPLNDVGQFVFAIDWQNSQFVSNHTNTTPFLLYDALPADRALDGSEDSLPEIASKAALTAIILLATAEYWLASERDESEYDRFFKRYQAQITLAQSRDNKVGPAVSAPHAKAGIDTGYNRNFVI
jgi:hypothetical protein